MRTTFEQDQPNKTGVKVIVQNEMRHTLEIYFQNFKLMSKCAMHSIYII